MLAIPFTLESGMTQVSGVAREGNDAIIVEYQTKFIGLFRSEIKTIQIPFKEVSEVFFSSNVFSCKLRIQLKTLRSIGDFPSPKQGELELNVSRKYREQGRSFSSSVNLSVSKYEMLEEQDDEWV